MAHVFDKIGLAIAIAGIAIISWGSLVVLIRFLRHEGPRLKGQEEVPLMANLRCEFGGYLMLGLEFLVAADIVHTVARPDFQSLGILAAIVGIRTVISIFLEREMKAVSECNRKVGFAPKA